MPSRLLPITLTLCALVACTMARPLRAQQPAPDWSEDQIASYVSDITVNATNTLTVFETVRILDAGTQPLAIYRDFPTRYSDRFGNSYSVHLDVTSLERDGQPQAFHLRKLPNGFRIAMDKLQPGRSEHIYELSYSVDREIGLFPDHDELYWNVTGNGWTLPIQKVTAIVHLPRGIAQKAILLDAYTGRPGSADTSFTASADSQGNATFNATRPLAPHEGLTIVVRWPKGFVSAPTDEQQHRYFLEDNRPTIIGLVGLGIVLAFYLLSWFVAEWWRARRRVGPRHVPPRGLSPAVIRCFWRSQFDGKAMVANLVDLAVKKRLAILENGAGEYILGRNKPGPSALSDSGNRRSPAPPTADEKLILEKVFAISDTVGFERVYRKQLGATLEALRQRVRLRIGQIYFVANSGFAIPGLLISLAVVIRCGLSVQGAQENPLLVLSAVLLPWSLACISVGELAISAWRHAFLDSYHVPAARRQAVVISAIFISLLVGMIAGLWALESAASAIVVLFLAVFAVLNFLWLFLMKSPARSGRRLMDQIEAFRAFLSEDQNSRDARILIKITPDEFEKLLPYAIALNLEKAWGDRLASALAQTTRDGKSLYSPSWYSGAGWDPIAPSTFVTSLSNSFSSTIANSVSHR